jgi:chromate reductase
MVTLLGICGSLRKSSLNRGLLRTVGELLPEGTGYRIYEGLELLPLFNNDDQDPPSVVALKDAVASVDGLVIGVPEYNYSIPGVLKNALDWLSRPPATSPMRNKPVAMCGAASGMSGTIRAQTHLRQMLVYSDCPTLNQPEVCIPRAHERFDKDGKLIDESTRGLVKRFGEAVVQFVDHNKKRS